MIIKTQEIYKCEYCRKLYQIKRFAIQHEKTCRKNPVNYRCCFSCCYLHEKDFEVIEDADFGISTTYKLLYCEKINCFLYPPKVEEKNNAIITDSSDIDNIPMKKECEFLEEYRGL